MTICKPTVRKTYLAIYFAMSCSILRNVVVVLVCIQLFMKTATPAIVTNHSFIDKQEDDCEDETVFTPLLVSDAFLVRVGTCDEGRSTLVNILKSNVQPPFVYYTICHNEDFDATLWSKHYIDGSLLGSIPSPPRPKCFAADIFYIRSPIISPQNSYTKITQFETVDRLLGLGMAANFLNISAGSQWYLSRGHLSPFADHVTPSHKNSTFYFINACPQWQIINNRNWRKIEDNVRDKALELRSVLTIYTGTYGITRLPNSSGIPTEIWLGRQIRTGYLVPKLPVSELLWKVIHNEFTNQAVAVVTVNNPHVPRTVADEICEDVCGRVPWVIRAIGARLKEIQDGYTYCCRVQDLAARISYAPQLGNLELLT